MNEIELLSDLRGQMAVDSEARLGTVRDRLLEAIAGSAPQHPVRPAFRRDRWRSARRVRRALLAASLAATAAILAWGILRAGPFGPASGHPTGAPLPAQMGPYQLTAQVLRAAALSAASRPTQQPDAEQWIYSKVMDDQLQGGVSSSESWVQFDGRTEAYLQGGRLVVHPKPVPPSQGANALGAFLNDMTPQTAYAALTSLPVQDQALLKVVDAAVAADPQSVAAPGGSPVAGSTRQALEFDFLTALMWNAAQASPPTADAAVFRTLATIPGVATQTAVTDAAGRPAISLSDPGSQQQLLLDPHTYQVTGLRVISNGHWPSNPLTHKNTGLPRGTVVDSLAYQTIAFVSGPGRR